jgi:hypothetical protein
MAEWISTFGRALLFDGAAFDRLRQRRNVFAEGLLVILLVALLAGLPGLISNTIKALQNKPLTSAEAAEATQGFASGLDQARAVLENLPPEVRAAAQVALDQASENFRMGLEIGTRVASLPTPLPRPVPQILEQIGAWASRPFGGTGIPLAAATLGAWLGYGIWVMLFAKLLGGRASLASFFGTTAIFAVPHLLMVLRWVPYLGGLLALIAFIWGLALYVKATAASHQLTLDRALLAVAFIPIVLPGMILWIVLALSALK